jgi:hypothetical protein
MIKMMMTTMLTANHWKHDWVQSSRSKAQTTEANSSIVTGDITNHHKVSQQKKKGGSEKASAAIETSYKKSWSKCGHCNCGISGHAKSKCWKIYSNKAPSKSSTEASSAFLDDELFIVVSQLYPVLYKGTFGMPGQGQTLHV